MQTLSTLEFVPRLAAGLGFGALIGAELQWRAGWRGLRTNVLVAADATLFVLYSDISGSLNPTQVAAYVVSGIGFLGGGVILRSWTATPPPAWNNWWPGCPWNRASTSCTGIPPTTRWRSQRPRRLRPDQDRRTEA